MGFCPRVYPGNSWSLPSASITLGRHLIQLKKTIEYQSSEMHRTCLQMIVSMP